MVRSVLHLDDLDDLSRNRLFSAEEAATFLGVPVANLLASCHDGRLPSAAIYRIGNRVEFNPWTLIEIRKDDALMYMIRHQQVPENTKNK